MGNILPQIYGMANRGVVINRVRNLILNKVYQARIHTGFHCFAENQSHFSHNNIFFIIKTLPKLKIWLISCLNYLETQERGLKE